MPIGTSVTKLSVRLAGFHEIQPFRELKAFQIGKFISVQGNVVRVSPVKPFISQVAFQCGKCLQSMVIPLKEGIYRTPTRCQTSHCTSKSFVADRSSSATKCRDWQKIKIQEIVDLDRVEDEGRIPRILEAELCDDLVDAVVPGEMVILSGILKTIETLNDKGLPFNGANSGALYLEVVSIEKKKHLDAVIGGPHSDAAVEASPSRISEILAVSQNKRTLQTLVRSFCPHIYGNELVKMGLLLGLFGGSRRSSASSPYNGSIAIRSDPHVLVVGDPGLGKSQLLNFAAAVAPRAIYVCANTSTAVGLTATVQDGALEAGALVLADQGCCCIDEFDKITGDGWRGLLDVMEQQTVNVAKAGVVCALPARTSILAAANPVGGHYSKEKSVVENLRMDDALLSRFDLIFVLLDRPNADMDKVLTEHVLGNLKAKDASFPRTTPATITSSSSSFLNSQVPRAPTTLKEKLDPSTEVSLVSEDLLRAYIAYARQRITPRMTEEAAEVLQAFYLELRRHRKNEETLPITTRHLESMIRLSEARAKLELRTFVTSQDARDVVELLRFSTDELHSQGVTPQNLLRKGRPGSKSSALKRYASELIKVSSRTGDIDFTRDQLQAIFDVMNITELGFRELLDALNEHGYILKRNQGYRLIVT